MLPMVRGRRHWHCCPIVSQAADDLRLVAGSEERSLRWAMLPARMTCRVPVQLFFK